MCRRQWAALLGPCGDLAGIAVGWRLLTVAGRGGGSLVIARNTEENDSLPRKAI